MTILARFALFGVVAAFAASLTSPDDAQGRVFAIVFFTLVGLGILYDIGRLCLAWYKRQERDVDALLSGTCPKCGAQGKMEVTSDCDGIDSAGFRLKETEIVCLRCHAELRIGNGEGGPVVTRLNF